MKTTVLQKKTERLSVQTTLINQTLIAKYKSLFKGISTCPYSACLMRFSVTRQQLASA